MTRSPLRGFLQSSPNIAVFALLAVAASSAACRNSMSAAENIGWAEYNNGLDGQRFAALDRINTRNVTQLKRVCELTLGEEGPFQAGPIVVGDRMFITTGHTTVAMNATTCFVYWRHVDGSGTNDPISVNRGVAYMDGRVYRGMPGVRLAAFDATTGRVAWDVKVGDAASAEFLSSAPVAWNGMVFIGVAGSDWGVRGHVMAFDAATGHERWRFYTVPMGSERGADTWPNAQSASRGGGAMWTSYTLDPQAGELFVPTGNPAPDFAPDARPGDNLFTNSIVVLDAKSGTLKWWYQGTPHDGFDYDMAAAPALYTTRDGDPRFAAGSKGGFLHVVSRKTHTLVFKVPVTTILNHDKKPTLGGIRACPGPLGGVEWNGPAFDPETQTIYTGAVDWCGTYKVAAELSPHKPGEIYVGTGYTSDPGEQASGWVTAIDAGNGAVRWKFKTPKPVVAGITPTSGGLLLTGDLAGTFYAFDKSNGAVLFTANANGAMAGGVITYLVAGTQYVAGTAGNVSRMTFQTTGTPRLIIGALDRPEGRPEVLVSLPPITPNGPAVGVLGAPPAALSGQQIFDQFCSSCHGKHGEGGAGGPSLRVPTARRDLHAIEEFVKNPAQPMPKMYPDALNDAGAAAVSAYVQTLQGGARP